VYFKGLILLKGRDGKKGRGKGWERGKRKREWKGKEGEEKGKYRPRGR